MAISIGDAMLKVGIDKKDFDQGMTGIGNSLAKHRKAIGTGMVALGAVITGIATKSVLDFAKMGDEIQKMALRTGFSTEALSELKHAAEISGAELSSLEKGVKKMSKTIVDANDGMATYVRSFDRIGLSAEELIELSPEEQFEKITMAIAELENETLKAATAQDIFGRAGTQLLPLLDAGAEGIAALRQEAHDLGIVFDQEAADKAAALTDANHRLTESFSAIKIIIAEQLVPSITPLIDRLRKAVSAVSDWAKENPELTKRIVILTTIVGLLLVPLGGMLVMLPFLTAGFSTLAAMIKGTTAAFIGFRLAILEITLLLAGLSMMAYGFWLLWRKVKGETLDPNFWNQLKADLKMFGTGLMNLSQSIIPGFNDEVETTEKSVADVWKENRSLIDSFVETGEKGANAFKSISSAVDELDDDLVRLAINQEKVWPTTKEYAARMADKIERFSDTATGRELLSRQGIQGFATGGIAMRPMTARIAEKGPEAVIPLSKMMNQANIYVELDGRVIAKAIGQPLVDEIRLKTGVHI